MPRRRLRSLAVFLPQGCSKKELVIRARFLALVSLAFKLAVPSAVFDRGPSCLGTSAGPLPCSGRLASCAFGATCHVDLSPIYKTTSPAQMCFTCQGSCLWSACPLPRGSAARSAPEVAPPPGPASGVESILVNDLLLTNQRVPTRVGDGGNQTSMNRMNRMWRCSCIRTSL